MSNKPDPVQFENQKPIPGISGLAFFVDFPMPKGKPIWKDFAPQPKKVTVMPMAAGVQFLIRAVPKDYGNFGIKELNTKIGLRMKKPNDLAGLDLIVKSNNL